TADHLFGNLGADTFDFTDEHSSTQHQTTANHISDFSEAQNDRVEVNIEGHQVSFTSIQTTAVTSVESAISFATTNGLFNNGHNVVFVAGATDGYLLVDGKKNGLSGEQTATDFAIILDGVNSTALFHSTDVIGV